jgi:hypothetical protein
MYDKTMVAIIRRFTIQCTVYGTVQYSKHVAETKVVILVALFFQIFALSIFD